MNQFFPPAPFKCVMYSPSNFKFEFNKQNQKHNTFKQKKKDKTSQIFLKIQQQIKNSTPLSITNKKKPTN